MLYYISLPFVVILYAYFWAIIESIINKSIFRFRSKYKYKSTG